MNWKVFRRAVFWGSLQFAIIVAAIVGMGYVITWLMMNVSGAIFGSIVMGIFGFALYVVFVLANYEDEKKKEARRGQ